MFGRSTRQLARGVVVAASAMVTSSVLISALVVTGGSVQASESTSIDAGRLIVKVRGTSAAISAAGAMNGTDGMHPIGPDTWVVEVDEAHRSAVLSSLARRDDVEWVEPDHVVQSADLPNDPDVANQTYLTKVGAADAWHLSRGSASVVVAVLDTQVDTTHPDLSAKLLPGSSFITGCPEGIGAEEDADHGTLVAGIIGASTDNAMGIAGLGWDTRVLPLQVLCDNGFGLESTVAPAIRYAADAGARVINLSLAADGAGSLLREAVTYAQSKGVLIVAAAGNKGSTNPQYPAALAGVISVGATYTSDVVVPFSNRGTWVDVMAPGCPIFST
ncbi:MAG: S8 family serine peptidase, partial [Acidimicrobiia bacterium]